MRENQFQFFQQINFRWEINQHEKSGKKIEQFKEDSEKKEIDWIIHNQNEVFEQMLIFIKTLLITKNFNYILLILRQKIQLHLKMPYKKVKSLKYLKFKHQIQKFIMQTLYHLALQHQYDFIQIYQTLTLQMYQMQFKFQIKILNFNQSIQILITLIQDQSNYSMFIYLLNSKSQHYLQYTHNYKIIQFRRNTFRFLRNTNILFSTLGFGIRKLNKLLQLTIKLDDIKQENIFELLQGIIICTNLCRLTLTFNRTNLNNIDQFGDHLKQLQNIEYLNIQFQNTKVNQADNLQQEKSRLQYIQNFNVENY
ncbi:unnamed protein product [Paramecium sonneborni]|uniref:Uncharacterized protein n=1 Tax=Paramecium sonneborni TaxID=65129 RepID=A0A8S1R8D2_9CILI|nr:unnamed protein product [Paramecium sonneborni]